MQTPSCTWKTKQNHSLHTEETFLGHQILSTFALVCLRCYNKIQDTVHAIECISYSYGGLEPKVKMPGDLESDESGLCLQHCHLEFCVFSKPRD